MKKYLLFFAALAALSCASLHAQTVVTSNDGRGLQIGKSPTQKVAFHGAKPVVQRSGSAQVALTDSTGGSTANTTLAAVTATNSTDQSATINADFAKLTRLVNELRAALVEKGTIKGGP